MKREVYKNGTRHVYCGGGLRYRSFASCMGNTQTLHTIHTQSGTCTHLHTGTHLPSKLGVAHQPKKPCFFSPPSTGKEPIWPVVVVVPGLTAVRCARLSRRTRFLSLAPSRSSSDELELELPPPPPIPMNPCFFSPSSPSCHTQNTYKNTRQLESKQTDESTSLQRL